jgi:uncharacterized membrane protein
MAKKIPANDIEAGKPCAALSYLFPVGLIWYLADSTMRKNRFAAFHVHQSLAAFLVVLAGYIVGLILVIIFIGFVIWAAAAFAGAIWFIQGLVYSLNGREEELWLVGTFGRRFDF